MSLGKKSLRGGLALAVLAGGLSLGVGPAMADMDTSGHGVQITKVDQDGKPMPGVQFQLASTGDCGYWSVRTIPRGLEDRGSDDFKDTPSTNEKEWEGWYEELYRISEDYIQKNLKDVLEDIDWWQGDVLTAGIQYLEGEIKDLEKAEPVNEALLKAKKDELEVDKALYAEWRLAADEYGDLSTVVGLESERMWSETLYDKVSEPKLKVGETVVTDADGRTPLIYANNCDVELKEITPEGYEPVEDSIKLKLETPKKGEWDDEYGQGYIAPEVTGSSVKSVDTVKEMLYLYNSIANPDTEGDTRYHPRLNSVEHVAEIVVENEKIVPPVVETTPPVLEPSEEPTEPVVDPSEEPTTPPTVEPTEDSIPLVPVVPSPSPTEEPVEKLKPTPTPEETKEPVVPEPENVVKIDSGVSGTGLMGLLGAGILGVGALALALRNKSLRLNLFKK